MYLTTNDNIITNDNITTNASTELQQTSQEVSTSESQQILQPKTLSYLQIIEICCLCFILIENIIICILTYREKASKQILSSTK